jgi:hypothetical protein
LCTSRCANGRIAPRFGAIDGHEDPSWFHDHIVLGGGGAHGDGRSVGSAAIAGGQGRETKDQG